MSATREIVETDPVITRQGACCPACGSRSLYDFFHTDRLPVHVGLFYATQEEALRAPTGKITLAFCRQCGFLFNRSFDPSLLHYEPGYEVGLQFSPTFQAFIQEVAERLVDRFDLHNKRVMEIGCGNAYFLKMLCELGANEGIGVDPTVASEGDQPCEPGSLRLIRSYFDEQLTDLKTDFVCCLSVFEHVPRPAEMLQAVRSLVQRQNAGVYFEVFNAQRAIQEQEIWSIHYEQCNCFGRDSLTDLFRRCGFRVLKADTCYEGDQYLSIEAVADRELETSGSLEKSPLKGVPSEVKQFEQTHVQRMTFWKAKLDQFQAASERVVVWGTGGKGISFLNTLDTADIIPLVVEINCEKQGKHVPGSGQLIVPPSFLAEYRPTKVIITNALYESEMKQQAHDLGVDPEFLVA